MISAQRMQEEAQQKRLPGNQVPEEDAEFRADTIKS
jgi:hypothetical protein